MIQFNSIQFNLKYVETVCHLYLYRHECNPTQNKYIKILHNRLFCFFFSFSFSFCNTKVIHSLNITKVIHSLNNFHFYLSYVYVAVVVVYVIIIIIIVIICCCCYSSNLEHIKWPFNNAAFFEFKVAWTKPKPKQN